MAELISLIIFFGSIAGMGMILFRKIPAIAEIPEISGEFGIKIKLWRIKERIRNSRYFKSPSFEILLQKILSKIRILSLKAEKKTSVLLQKLREKSTKKKESDIYWQELKKSIHQDKSKSNKNNPPE